MYENTPNLWRHDAVSVTILKPQEVRVLEVTSHIVTRHIALRQSLERHAVQPPDLYQTSNQQRHRQKEAKINSMAGKRKRTTFARREVEYVTVGITADPS